ncbi:MAG TPA: hypothetical protein VF646_17795 [Cytophagales bacterium]
MRGDNFLSDALAKLPPAGFRKQRDYFYLVREPNLLVVYRKYNRAVFEGYYLAFTHTFLGNVQGPGGRYVIPPLLAAYPVSLSITEIQAQFRRHASIEDFDCDLNAYARELAAARAMVRKPLFPAWLRPARWFKRNSPSEGFSSDPVEVVLREGLQFMAQFSPAFSHRVLTRVQGLQSPLLVQMQAECQQYLDDHNIPR